MPDERGTDGRIEIFEIVNAFEFGFGGLQAYLERAALTGIAPSVLVISLRHLKQIDSVGVRCIAQSVSWSQAHHCSLFVMNVTAAVRRSLATAGVLCNFQSESPLAPDSLERA